MKGQSEDGVEVVMETRIAPGALPFVADAEFIQVQVHPRFWRRVWIAVLFVFTGEAPFGRGTIVVAGLKVRP